MNPRLERFRRWAQSSLRFKLILGVAGVHALLMSLFIWDVTTRQRDHLLLMQAEQAEAMAHAMATSSSGWLAAHDLSGLQELVEAQRRYPELIFAMLLDSDGRILAHSDPQRRGQFVRDLPTAPALAVLTRTPQLVDVVAPAVLAGRQVGWVRVGIGQRKAGAQLAQNTRDGILYALAAIAIGTVMASVLGTGLTTKLYAIREVSAAIRAGRRNARVGELGHDEAAELGRDFNEMLDALGAREAEIHSLNADLERRVKERTEELLHSTVARQESEERFSRFMDNSPAIAWLKDSDGRYVFLNKAYEERFGVKLENFKGKRDLDVWPAEIAREYRQNDDAVRAGGKPVEVVEITTDAAGNRAWWLTMKFPLTDASGRSYVGGTAIDVTARRQAEEEIRELNASLERRVAERTADLRAANEKLRREMEERLKAEETVRLNSAALEAAANAVLITDRAGVIMWANSAFETLTGYRPAEAVGTTPGKLLKSGRHSREFYVAMWETILQGRVWHGELINRRKDGTEYPEEQTITPLRNARGEVTHFISIKLDITARRQAEEALRQSEERFRQVVENISEVFWMSDASRTRMLYISPGYEAIWGRPCAELYRSLAMWDEAIHPDDRPRIMEARKRLREAGYNESYRILRPDGTERWIRSRAYPVYDASGNLSRIVGVADDISGEKRLEEQFLRAQRMEAIGTLASGVAHDLNNILSPMMLGADLLRDKLSDPRDKALLAMIDTNAKRGAGVIRQLLTFSRGIGGTRIAVQPRHLMKEMGQMMRETFPRNIEIDVGAPAELWPVLADATQLHQVLMNLCVNARDAMLDGGRLTLRARNEVLDAGDARLQPPAVAGRYVVLEVIDTGCGIPPGIMHRIYDPFFTTKGIGKGTGLGLSTVLGIVKGHNGLINVYSEQGQGTRFSVYLPAVGEKAPGAEAGAADAVPPPRGRQELVIVVDDEKLVLEATRMVLEMNGYRVLPAQTGEQAAQLFLAHMNEVQVLLTDIMMPGMDGVALITMLRELKPDLRVIATSGLEHGSKREALAALGVTSILTKPCEPVQLLRALDLILHPLPQ